MRAYNKGKRLTRYGLYLCSFCGEEKETRIDPVKAGRVKGCGCQIGKGNITHDKSKTPTYHTWSGMIARCYNLNNSSYKDYGGRGIQVCDRWRFSFSNFLADMGSRPSKNHSIDRIDNNSEYNPNNCKWATRKEQSNNRRTNRLMTAYGVTQNVTQWAETLEVPMTRIWSRLEADWSVHATLFTPLRGKRVEV